MQGRRNSLLVELMAEFSNNGIDLVRMSPSDLDGIKKICNQKDCIIWLNDHMTMKPYFINDFGLGYYGFKKNDLSGEGFDFYDSFLNPDHFNDVHQTITFFVEHPNGQLNMPYNVKNQKGEWRWTYSAAIPLNHTSSGKVHLVLAVVHDIEALLENGNGSAANGKFARENLKRYQSLTSREREILILIASEMTSHEIADALHIETSTVDTHRKNLIKKLNVKSSVGLVKFELLFSDNNL